MRRPLFTLGWFFLAGTAAALLLPGGALPGLFLLALLAGGALLVWRRPGAAGPFLFAAALLLAWAWAPLHAPPATAMAGREVWLEGVVEAVAHSGDSTRYDVRAELTGPQGERCTTNLRLFSRDSIEAQPGVRVRGYVTPQLSVSEGERRFSLLRDQRFLYAYADGSVEMEGEAPGFYGAVLRYRERLLRQNRQGAPGEAGALINAMLLGEKSGLSAQARADLNAAGLAHVVAVSGFHLSVLTGFLTLVFRLCRLPRRLGAALALPFVAFFTALAGFSPSILRAAAMTTLLLLAQLLRRPYDGRTAWGAAVILCCVLNPYSLTDIGCVLSYSSTLGIILWYPAIQRGLLHPFRRVAGLPRRLLQAVAGGLAMTGAALLLSLPFVTFAFGYVSIWSGLSSLLVLPLVSPLLGLSMAAGGLGLFWEEGARWLLGLAAPIARCVLALSHWIAQLPLAVYPVRYPAVWAALAGCCGLLALGLTLQGRARRGLVPGALLGVLLSLLGNELIAQNTLLVTALEERDALLLARGRTALVLSAPSDAYEVQLLRNAVQAGGYQEVWLVIPKNTADDTPYAGELIRALSPRWVAAPAEGRYAPHIAYAAGGELYPLAPMQLEWGRAQLRLDWVGGSWVAELAFGETKLLKTFGECAIIEPKQPAALALGEGNTLLWQGEGAFRCVGGQGRSWAIYERS